MFFSEVTMKFLDVSFINSETLQNLPKALVTIDETSTSCSGRPVVQSKSLSVGSSRQEAQTPHPAAHRKRTCCSLRCDTVNDFCKAKKREKNYCKLFKVYAETPF